ncbi:DUF3015 family protein [Nitrospira moscoviensis]|uniref:DUF3015 family protein n=1 Tax=Nitrospira moscoviensis TaxID=42253 RepID=UPI0016519188|nr:DUF3015 family protein [Nitrospira moscoviensis]
MTIDFGGLCPQFVQPNQALPFNFVDDLGSGTPKEIVCQAGGTTYFKLKNWDDTNAKAKILIDVDSSKDTLRMENTRVEIVTTTPSSMPQGYVIQVWREHTYDPHTDDSTPPAWYKTVLSGTMWKGPSSPSGNWVKMDPGYVTNPIGSAERTLGTAKTWNYPCVPSCPASSNFNLSTSGKWLRPSEGGANELGMDDRNLRMKMSVKGKAGDWLKVHPLQINSQENASQDDDDSDECTDQTCRCTSFIKVITVTTSKAGRWITDITTTDSKSAKLDAFAEATWPSLSQDIARGEGEHLSSLAALLDIPVEGQSAFFAFAQDEYAKQAEKGKVKRKEFVAQLQQATARYGKDGEWIEMAQAK